MLEQAQSIFPLGPPAKSAPWAVAAQYSDKRITSLIRRLLKKTTPVPLATHDHLNF